MKKYIFIFSINPVQKFISEARKLRDLQAGSSFLSHLTEIGMDYFNEKYNGEIIFPYYSPVPRSLPNRFTGIITTDNPEKIGKEIEEFLKEKIIEKYREVLKTVSNNLEETTGEKQIESYFSFYWIFYPLNGDYKTSFIEAEKYLGSIKNIRKFNQLAEIGRKCSICGERNALFYYNENGDYKIKKENLREKFFAFEAVNLKDKKDNSIQISKNEGLCAVCLFKRFYKNKGISSLAEICLLDVMSEIKKLHSFKILKDTLGPFFNIELLYEENLTENYFSKNNIPVSKLGKVKETYKKLMSELKDKGIRLMKYYAVIMLDGDNMGKWLAGEMALPENINSLDEFHKIIAENLYNYSQKVNEIIPNTRGVVIYAGGDDLLAFVNIKYLFQILKELRENYPDFNINVDKKPTASAGVVIAHYKTPLSSVLKMARNLEEEVKKIDNEKNKLGILVLKRSGEHQKTILKWENLEILEKILSHLSTDDVSPNFIHQLDKEMNFLKKETIPEFEPAIKVEIERLIEQAWKREESKEHLKFLQGMVYNLYVDLSGLNFGNFIMALNIIDFINRKVY